MKNEQIQTGLIPVEVVFHPSWWFKHEGLTFDEDFFFPPAYRVEAERKMATSPAGTAAASTWHFWTATSRPWSTRAIWEIPSGATPGVGINLRPNRRPDLLQPLNTGDKPWRPPILKTRMAWIPMNFVIDSQELLRLRFAKHIR